LSILPDVEDYPVIIKNYIGIEVIGVPLRAANLQSHKLML
jgi:hypothetical protein